MFTTDMRKLACALGTAVLATTAAAGDLKVQYRYWSEFADRPEEIRSMFQIVNSGTTNVPLADLKIRYWYTNDNNRPQQFVCDWAAMSSSNVKGSFTPLPAGVTNANTYLEVGFYGGYIPPGGNTGEIQTRVQSDNWSQYIKSNDYSNNSSLRGTFYDWDHVTLYQGNTLVWGIEPPGFVVLTAPQNLVAWPGDRKAFLDWDPVVGAASYKVQRWNSATAMWVNVIPGPVGAVDSYTDEPSPLLTNYQTYYYRVQAVSGAGVGGPYSSTVTVMPFSPLTAPTLTAVGNPGVVNMSWTAIAGASYYEVYRYDFLAAIPHFDTLGRPTGTTFDDNTGIIGYDYQYAVKAKNPINSSGASLVLVRHSTAPVVPTLSGSAGDGRVNLSWAPAIVGATSYRLERRTLPSGSFSQIQNLGPSTTSTTDFTVVNWTSYEYRLRVEKPAGVFSIWSNVVTASPVPVSNLQLQYMVRSSEVAPFDNHIRPFFRIQNNGTSAVNLNELTIRYYYTKEGSVSQQYWCDYAAMSCGNVRSSFVTMSTPKPTANTYLELGFNGGNIPAGGNTGEIQSRFNKLDWSNYDETNDYSYSTQSSYGNWDHVTLYRNGVKVGGLVP